MNQHVFVARALAYNRAHGYHPFDDEHEWESAHYPRPRGKGNTEIPLTFNQHQMQGLYQSAEEGYRCFWTPSVKSFLDVDGFLCENWFELYELFDQYAAQAPYKDPESGEVKLMDRAEAQSFGWVPVNLGTTRERSQYKNPATGEIQLLSRSEAKERGWVGWSAGKACYRDSSTQHVHLVTAEEAASKGWIHIRKNRSSYVDPVNGTAVTTTREDAAARGLVSVSCGKKSFRNPITGEVRRLTKEEADSRGWLGANIGTTLFKDPATGLVHKTDLETAQQHGWVGIATGSKHNCKPVEVTSSDGVTRVFDSITEAANSLGLRRSNLSNVLSGNAKTHKGHTVRFLG